MYCRQAVLGSHHEYTKLWNVLVCLGRRSYSMLKSWVGVGIDDGRDRYDQKGLSQGWSVAGSNCGDCVECLMSIPMTISSWCGCNVSALVLD